MNTQKEILIITGETSGDMHAAQVVKELKLIEPNLQFFGSGGAALTGEGVELLAKVEDLAVMGFSGILKLLPRLKNLKNTIIKRIQHSNVPLAILVDYPGFNINLAQTLKSLPKPPKILYYIAPQVWAWHTSRIKKMKRFIDVLAVILPFEETIFNRVGIKTYFVGHPLLDEIDLDSNTPEYEKEKGEYTLSLLPGSRKDVFMRHIKPMLLSVKNLKSRFVSLKVLIARAPNIDEKLYQSLIQGLDWISHSPDSRFTLRISDAAAVCSGTATLEAALLNIPQVVVYRTSAINYFIAQQVVKVPFISLVNLIAGRQIVPELIQNNFTSEKLVNELISILEDSQRKKAILEGYCEVRKLLGNPGAALKTANIAYEMIKK